MNISATLNKMKDRRSREGMTTLEFALVLPVLFILLLCLVEMGTICYSWLTLQRAAQDGARFASTGQGYEEGTRLTQIQEKTGSMLSVLRDGNKEIIIRSWPDMAATGEGISGNAGEPCQIVEVMVTYDYEPFTPLIAQVLPPTITLLGSDRKVNEPWYPCDSP
ncbi:TadE/TadG family type IV pilus assembly protein [Salidesulfovibrio onnuriiensis]|uniref:TadE/TadG family type IV pilus assembly protein n=1 Tax=Salidesulfovibrio onnuriiensis TaxID=2583823 RepID=UPI00202B7F47|nr:TadE/TadG family type IV pilus assembly protein [Salidesulfovibrio onnuriiensis]